MEYKDHIRGLVTKKHITFNELTDIIVKSYGQEQENGLMTMTAEILETYLREILRDDNSFTMAIAVHNSNQLQSHVSWYYDIEKGDGYLREK